MVKSGEWNVKYLYHNFERNEENCKLFPVTTQILDSLGAQVLRYEHWEEQEEKKRGG